MGKLIGYIYNDKYQLAKQALKRGEYDVSEITASIIYASEKGKADIVNVILKDEKAMAVLGNNINYLATESIIAAVRYNRPNTLKVLLENHKIAETAYYNGSIEAGLSICIEKEHVECIELLEAKLFTLRQPGEVSLDDIIRTNGRKDRFAKALDGLSEHNSWELRTLDNVQYYATNEKVANPAGVIFYLNDYLEQNFMLPPPGENFVRIPAHLLTKEDVAKLEAIEIFEGADLLMPAAETSKTR